MDERSPKRVAGVFLERSRGYLLIADAMPIEHDAWQLVLLAEEPADWDALEPSSVAFELDRLGAVLGAFRDELSSVAIASYGPFVSLKPGRGYGVVRADTADIPLRGLDLCQVFSGHLGLHTLEQRAKRLQIQSDACACAVGEAYLRKTGKDEVLAYVFATEGVGIGLAKGREVFPSALHPEIGLLPAVAHLGDPIARTKEESILAISRKAKLDFQSISQLARNDAIWKRYEAMKGANDSSLQFASSSKEEMFWDIRACYLAEVCVACTVVSPPHKIIIGADIDPKNDVHLRAWDYFKHFIEGRLNARDPAFQYTELKKGFIDQPFCLPGKDEPPPPAVTGAIGLCYLAAAK